MNKTEAKRVVVVSTAGTVAVTFVGTVADGEIPAPAVGIGGAAAGILLAGLAEVWPDGAATIAATMLATAALVFGEPAWKALGKATDREDPILPRFSDGRTIRDALPGTVGASGNAPRAQPATPAAATPRLVG